MKLVAIYLIWYVEEGLLSDDESYPYQQIETIIIPSMDGTIDELRAIFKTKLDKKYGQDKWDFAYFLGVAQTEMTCNLIISFIEKFNQNNI